MQNTPQTTTIKIAGMHCASCDVLVRTKLEGKGTITKVIPNRRENKLTITHTQPLSIEDINSLLCEYGYKVSNVEDVIETKKSSLKKNLSEALIYAIIFGCIYYVVKDLKIIPNVMANPTGGIGGAFALGLVASISTCMATTGALLAGYTHFVNNKSQVAKLTILFIVGRLLSYAFFGFIIGTFGGIFTGITKIEGVVNILVAAILIAVGLDMLKIISLANILDLLPGMKRIKDSFASRKSFSGSSITGAFLLGVSTYFLPCGFSLSTQAYAISTANPVTSLLIMTAFAAGTIPALFALGFLSKLRNSEIYSHVNKAIAVAVLFVGISYVLNTLTLYGLTYNFSSSNNISNNATPIQDGKQIAKMTATASGYLPNMFVIKKGIPVRWEIIGKEIFGCQGALTSPKAGVKLTYLKEGENIIEFTPTETGTINFSCSMGMFSGKFLVI